MAQSTTVHRLANGLTILAREVHSAPIATCWMWYRVGGRNEGVGISGISHWCEHMLFKGTPSMPKGAFDALIARNGGTFNGFTWIDFTAYYETLPADRLSLGLQIEADRMVNSLFDPAEVASERTVIISEREGNENNPGFWLDEEMRAAAFKVHPYRNGVIGWKSDLRAMTREDLYSHYQTYYTPSNGVLVLVGAFDTAKVLAEAEERFGGIPAGPTIPQVRGEEPAQQGERRVIVERPGAQPLIQIAYHAPHARSEDWAALTVLDAVLSGAKSPSLFGGGAQTNRSARLYRALVEGEKATMAGSSFLPTIDPYLFELSASVRLDRSTAEVETALLGEIERLRQEPVSADELAKIQRQMRAQFAYANERISNQAMMLGMWEMLDSHARLDTYIDQIASVTADDVLSAAQRYLGPKQRTVAVFEPAAPQAGTPPPRPAVAARAPFASGQQPAFYDAANPPATTPEVSRHVLANGVVALLQRNPVSPTVTTYIEVGAGQIHEPAGKHGLALFTAAALVRGTRSRSFAEITSATEDRGCSVNASGGRHTTTLSGKSLSEDLPLILEILAEMLQAPTFPADALDRLREQFYSGLRQQEHDTRAMAARLARKLLYPDSHPYHFPAQGEAESMKALTRDDAVAFAQRYHPAATTIAIVGDIDPPAVLADLERFFGAWQVAGDPPPQTVPDAPALTAPIREEVALDGKTQADLVWAAPGIARTDPDYYAAMLANLALGQLGLMGRLGENVRDRQGLAYYATSRLEADLGAGPWTVFAGVSPDKVDQALASIHDEVARLAAEGITAEERSDAIAYLTGALAISLEANAGIASLLLAQERYGLGLDYVARYPAILEAVSLDAIRAAAARFLRPESAVIAVAKPS